MHVCKNHPFSQDEMVILHVQQINMYKDMMWVSSYAWWRELVDKSPHMSLLDPFKSYWIMYNNDKNINNIFSLFSMIED